MNCDKEYKIKDVNYLLYGDFLHKMPKVKYYTPTKKEKQEITEQEKRELKHFQFKLYLREAWEAIRQEEQITDEKSNTIVYVDEEGNILPIEYYN